MYLVSRFKFFSVLFVLFAASGMVLYVYPKPSPAVIPADISHLPPVEVGDWVLRMGTETDSRLIRQLGGGNYSHIGMVVKLQPQIMVLHATNEEGRNKQNQVLLTPLSEFVSQDVATRYALARPQFLDTADKQSIAEQLMHTLGQPFVLAKRNESHLYCTTLLYEQIKIRYPAFSPQWQTVTAPLFEGEYLFPEAFANYPEIDWVYISNG
ncbi:C40 family peptidase [Paralysiella testudinis]|uniref:Permuted papain-like amidase enzyme, YaeF/YiiX, C92 family n=1 Tax=Paralysiella testudinis TaxID=2809020 RepID=A0A892ZJR7_9NEIS|nr:YiiX/YebB-like N1pC/P60 family cysteine hydrolase [Paralysiella testudinis]QRQ82873.1 hypothetical protein JQU52_05700 [Paralysiella testudinis]